MIATNVLNLLIVLSLGLIVFGCGEVLYKKGIPAQITHKIVHIGGGVVASLIPFFINLETGIILGMGLTLLLVFSKRRNLLKSIHKINDESIGALLFIPSLILTAVIFWPTNRLIFQGAALVLGLSDGLAGIVGAKYGRVAYNITGRKTIEGSFVFFLITFFILFGVLYVSDTSLALNKTLLIFGGSLLLTVVEAVFGRGWDNLFIPIFTGLILFFTL